MSFHFLKSSLVQASELLFLRSCLLRESLCFLLSTCIIILIFLCFAGTNIENVLRVWIHTAGQCQILFAMWERGIGDTDHPNCPLSQHSSKRQKNSSMWCRDPKLKQVLQWVWLVYKYQSFSARGCHV